jgi:4-hydroxybenzoate polyprenyltransferase/phosphoserine phosphatase
MPESIDHVEIVAPIPEPPGSASPGPGQVPLCVDLDGTLVKTDTLFEGLLLLLKRLDVNLLRLPFWLLRGRAHFKAQVAARAALDPASLPYNQELIEYLAEHRAEGRPVILVTGANQTTARSVADHLGIFDEVIAGDAATQLTGRRKAELLKTRYAATGFDYVGNSYADVPVWHAARESILVQCPRGAARRAREGGRVIQEFSSPAGSPRLWLRAMRPHQWAKNLIVFLPVIASHELRTWPVVAHALTIFICFCLMASGTYLLNDLLDLDSDRRHATKKHRPFAAGQLDLLQGGIACAAMITASLLLALTVPWAALAVLVCYAAMTLAYSFRFKQRVLLDVFLLAALYTIRLIAGHAATGIRYSHWLLGFSMFLFLSLALVKRAAELKNSRRGKSSQIAGRGYRITDLRMIENLGVMSGGLAVIVLAMYISSPDVLLLYQHPLLLHLLCPLVLYWIARVWMITHRGNMHGDPVVFALRDRVSYYVGIVAALVLIAATVSWPV